MLVISCGEPFAHPANPSLLKERSFDAKETSSTFNYSARRSARHWSRSHVDSIESPRGVDSVSHQFTNKLNFAPFEIPYRSATNESFSVAPIDQGASGE
jgi:hypothetical protein